MYDLNKQNDRVKERRERREPSARRKGKKKDPGEKGGGEESEGKEKGFTLQQTREFRRMVRERVEGVVIERLFLRRFPHQFLVAEQRNF